MQPKATTGLLAAIVVLLAANLVMQNSKPAAATAAPPESVAVQQGSGACCVPGTNCTFRSEPECVALGGTYLGPGTDCNSLNCNLAAPYVVQITTTHSEPNTSYLLRLWSDGAVDQWAINQFTGTPIPDWDGWLDLDPVQRADLNADGCVGVNDFLILLGDWDCES